MKNRIKDTLYCGVNQESILKANPVLNEEVLASLFEFVTDRYNIHKKKDVEKLPAPWTTNPILQIVKFTNVRREHDRESLNVIRNIASKTEYSLKDRFFNIILMRFWNKFESYTKAAGGELIKFPMSLSDFDAANRRIEAEPDHTWWSGAYYTCPVRSWMERIYFKSEVDPKLLNFSMAPIYFAKDVLTDELWDNIVACPSPKELFELLTAIPWMGKFLVYQWFVDFTYCEDYWFSENEYTVSGPGCTKGIDLLFADRDGMTHEECLFWMRDNQHGMFNKFGYRPEVLFDDLPEYDRFINIMSFENLMCELQKYMKGVAAVKIGKKPRGKANYDGTGAPNKIKKEKVVTVHVDLFNLGN